MDRLFYGRLLLRSRDRDHAARPSHHRSEEHTSELQSPDHLVCRLLLEKKKKRAPRSGSCPHEPDCAAHVIGAVWNYSPSFLFPCCGPHLHQHSFPTRRSSDLDGELELTTTSNEHERIKEWIGCFMEDYFFEAGIEIMPRGQATIDRKSTRLNSSHQIISYAVFCLKKKKNEHRDQDPARMNQTARHMLSARSGITLRRFFSHAAAPTYINTLSLHDALPIWTESLNSRPPRTNTNGSKNGSAVLWKTTSSKPGSRSCRAAKPP